MIREITKRQFEAYCHVKAPMTSMINGEVSWFEAYDKKLIGVIVFDFTDSDYGFIILGRDKRKLFRAIKISDTFYQSVEDAKKNLIKGFSEFENDGQDLYPQGDEKTIPNEILIPQVEENKLHNYFKILVNEPRFEAARNLIKEIAYSFEDVDGNYIKDFQTTGFDARLWELYLHMYLYHGRFSVDSKYQSPDFLASFFEKDFVIEAVTVNPSEKFDEPPPTSDEEIYALLRDYMPIKFGSPLTSKLNKRYWELEHVKGKPLIFAIHDYHMPASIDTLGSMTWARGALSDYLYGVRVIYSSIKNGGVEIKMDENGSPILEKIIEHKWKYKSIPSGFFELPDSENVSAVLFSNNATITTFNRMGKLAGLGSSDVLMIRHCLINDPNPRAMMPIPSVRNVDDPSYEEAWSDGMMMYHNPNARYPVDPNCFSEISHMLYDKDKSEFRVIMQPHDVISSFTINFIKTE